METNKLEIMKETPSYERSRKSSRNKELDLVMCNNCTKMLLKSSLVKHRRICSSKSYGIDLPMLRKTIPIALTDEFKRYVIGTMRNDEIGLKCKEDHSILLFGCRLYDKVKKSNNISGTRKDVRTKMRMLSHLHSHFLKGEEDDENIKIERIFGNMKDIFITRNFDALKKGIELYTGDDDNNMKPGLKTNLQHLLTKAAKTFRGQALTDGKDSEAKIFEQFLSVLGLWKVKCSFKLKILAEVLYLLK